MRVRGIKRYRHPKTGIVYCYHRATGTRMRAEFGSEAFFNELAELNGRAARSNGAGQAIRAGSLKALIDYYKATDAFMRLAPRTKSDYDKCFVFLEPLWHVPLTTFTAPQVVTLRAKWRKSRGICTVNKVLAVLSILMGHAIELGFIHRNPIRDVKKVQKATDAPLRNRPWNLSERQIVVAHAPAHLKLPIILGMFYGLREGDVLILPRSLVDALEIDVVTAKRRVPVRLPIFPELTSAIALHDDALRRAGHDPDTQKTLCLNSRGRTWTLLGFSASFRKCLKKLENDNKIGPGLTFHGLRHTVATVLAEAEVDEHAIAAWLGQLSSAMARHYSRQAERSRLVRKAAPDFKPLQNS